MVILTHEVNEKHENYNEKHENYSSIRNSTEMLSDNSK